jgi:hypothetical protein
MSDAATELIDFRDEVLAGAKVYLAGGPAPISELTRVLTSHLELDDQLPVRTMLLALVSGGHIKVHGHQMSLPAGGDKRDTNEREGDDRK